jgi:hypothetical protein
LRTNCEQAFPGDFLKSRDKVVDISRDQGLYAGDCRARRRARIAQRRLKLVQGSFLAALAQRPERSALTIRFRPDGRNRDYLFVQSLRAGAIHGEPTHQHNARLRARSQNHRYARQPRLKSLA